MAHRLHKDHEGVKYNKHQHSARIDANLTCQQSVLAEP